MTAQPRFSKFEFEKTDFMLQNSEKNTELSEVDK